MARTIEVIRFSGPVPKVDTIPPEGVWWAVKDVVLLGAGDKHRTMEKLMTGNELELDGQGEIGDEELAKLIERADNLGLEWKRTKIEIP